MDGELTGPRLGGFNAGITLAEEARKFYEPLIPIAMELQRQGLSLRDIADEFERRGILTRTDHDFLVNCCDRMGRPRPKDFRPHCWAAAQVRRVLMRGYEAANLPYPAKPRSANVPSVPRNPLPSETKGQPQCLPR
ncbi:MAG TPA: hypothetical protein VFE62_20580 [Gemmataceae bacterium]|nr:hypothetical protein [Gemmataceae bacterium]